MWGVGAGIVGARLYHIATSWDELPDEWWGPFAVWEGGLGIWGGIGLGVIVGAIVAHRSGASALALLDAAAPGLLIAQAIGRVGNWWNQELFGEPTDLAWGLEIDPERRPDEYLLSETFHPVFLYEALWNLVAAGVLLVLDRFYRFRPPALFALYVVLYTGFRFFLEQLRVDPSKEWAGMRVNAWVSLVLFVAALAFFIWWQFFHGRNQRARGASARPSRRRPWPCRAGASDPAASLSIVALPATDRAPLARDLRRAAASSVASIPSGMNAPCVLASLAAPAPATRNRHRKSH